MRLVSYLVIAVRKLRETLILKRLKSALNFTHLKIPLVIFIIMNKIIIIKY